VIAGAGTGKTRTLVHRVAYLVELGVEPESYPACSPSPAARPQPKC
jgi:ATP-dependent exoDNAse (exonuclease V) beta subunit